MKFPQTNDLSNALPTWAVNRGWELIMNLEPNTAPEVVASIYDTHGCRPLWGWYHIPSLGEVFEACDALTDLERNHRMVQEMGMMPVQQIEVSMPYIGAVLSNNRHKERYFVRDKKSGRTWLPIRTEVRFWMNILSAKIAWAVAHVRHCVSQSSPLSIPLEVTVDGYFKNRRAAPDLSNLSKVILDAVAQGMSIDDKDLRYRDGEVNFGEAEPYLKIVVRGQPGETPPLEVDKRTSSSRESW